MGFVPSNFRTLFVAAVLLATLFLLWTTGIWDRRFIADWPDRRPIGMLHMASVGHRSPTNPRGWFNEKSINVHTPEGIQRFHSMALAYADRSIRAIREVGGQGMVVWDLEGEEYDHKITYIGDPRIAETLAPELSGIIDKFFQRYRDAGLKVGVTIRPQQFRDGQQHNVWDPARLMIEKVAYAKRRWGVSYIQVDTNRWGYYILPAAILRKVKEAHPDILLIPDHEWPGYHAFCAPLRNLKKEPARPEWLNWLYPRGFSVVFVSDGDPHTRVEELKAAVRAGDILMFTGWFGDRHNPLVRDLTMTPTPAR